MDLIREVNECRVCGNKHLVDVIDLGNLYVSDFVTTDADMATKVRAPLILTLCELEKGGCGLLQLKHTVYQDVMYSHYYYWSGINESMKIALSDITSKAKTLVSLNSGDSVLDIGCNDGTMLRTYGVPGVNLVGIDPAKNMPKYATEGLTKLISGYFTASAVKAYRPDFKAKIITAIAMFYDLDKPCDFVNDVVSLLDKDGIFIIQMADLKSMIERKMFDNICHEHLEYYGLVSLRNLLAKSGLEIFDVDFNDVNGGSVRFYIKLKGNSAVVPFDGAAMRLSNLEKQEMEMGLYSKESYLAFASKIENVKKEIMGFLMQEHGKGKKIYVYGASTKGNTLLQYFGLNYPLILGAAERNPDKYGRKTVGTMIPIFSEEDVRKQKPDYMLVLPWHFIDTFVARERQYLESGGKLIVPLPEFKVIGKQTD